MLYNDNYRKTLLKDKEKAVKNFKTATITSVLGLGACFLTALIPPAAAALTVVELATTLVASVTGLATAGTAYFGVESIVRNKELKAYDKAAAEDMAEQAARERDYARQRSRVREKEQESQVTTVKLEKDKNEVISRAKKGAAPTSQQTSSVANTRTFNDGGRSQ